MATWSIAVSSVTGVTLRPRDGQASWRRKSVIWGRSSLAPLGVGHPEALLGREREDAELALVAVVVHLVRRVAGLLEREHP